MCKQTNKHWSSCVCHIATCCYTLCRWKEVLKHGFLTSLPQLHTRNKHRARSFLEALKLQTAADLQRFGRKELQEALGPELRPFWEVLCRLSRGFSAFVSCPVVPAWATHAACPYWGFSFRPDGFAHCRERITSLIFIVSDSALLPPARYTVPPPPPPPTDSAAPATQCSCFGSMDGLTFRSSSRLWAWHDWK